MIFQLEIYQHFSDSKNSEDLWQRLHTRLAQYHICGVFYGVSDVPLALNMDGSYQAVYVKTSYPAHMRMVDLDGYQVEKDAGAVHCLTYVTPFIWDVNSRWVSAQERDKRLSNEVFWYDESIRVGLTISLRFGNSGGGIGFWAGDLSSE